MHLRAVDGSECAPWLQPGAPVSHVLLQSEHSTFQLAYLLQLAACYHDTLECLVALRLPRRIGPRSFSLRPDRGLVHLARLCARLRLLAWRDRISTCSLLLLAQEAARHHGDSGCLHLVVRRNSVSKRADWPRAEVAAELRATATDYELTRKAVAEALHSVDWTWLGDKEYNSLTASSFKM